MKFIDNLIRNNDEFCEAILYILFFILSISGVIALLIINSKVAAELFQSLHIRYFFSIYNSFMYELFIFHIC